tara:strand:- start:5307 stop:6236 length:930 start_codon:yes stop_codon:yes gene_type:complete
MEANKMEERTPVQARLFDFGMEIATEETTSPVFQHAIFCQTCLPYRKPPEDIRRWTRTNGNSKLIVTAGEIFNPRTEELEPVSLPYGSKARLIQTFFDTEAVKNQSPVIEVEKSLSAFVRRMDLAKNGRNVATVKEQLMCLSACRMHIILNNDEHLFQQEQKVIKNFSFWSNKSTTEEQSDFFPSARADTVELDSDYFKHLLLHAVPLDERALKALSHSPSGLDIYTWLAHRLHRVNNPKGQLVPWVSIREQFGLGYTGKMSQFRRKFTQTLKMVLTQYPSAKLDETPGGLLLFNSKPPISRRLVSVQK